MLLHRETSHVIADLHRVSDEIITIICQDVICHLFNVANKPLWQMCYMNWAVLATGSQMCQINESNISLYYKFKDQTNVISYIMKNSLWVFFIM